VNLVEILAWALIWEQDSPIILSKRSKWISKSRWCFLPFCRYLYSMLSSCLFFVRLYYYLYAVMLPLENRRKKYKKINHISFTTSISEFSLLFLLSLDNTPSWVSWRVERLFFLEKSSLFYFVHISTTIILSNCLCPFGLFGWNSYDS
jgi:hypothetical protein